MKTRSISINLWIETYRYPVASSAASAAASGSKVASSTGTEAAGSVLMSHFWDTTTYTPQGLWDTVLSFKKRQRSEVETQSLRAKTANYKCLMYKVGNSPRKRHFSVQDLYEILRYVYFSRIKTLVQGGLLENANFMAPSWPTSVRI